MDTQSFYTTVGSVSFLLLGLWWIVVQGHPTWSLDPNRRRMAYAVSLHFLLPGAMSILSLVAPDVSLLWRATFALAGVVGVVAAVYIVQTLREDNDAPRIVRAIELIAIPTYAIISVVALAPELATGLGIGLSALQVEATIVAVLVLFGAQAAWILMIEPPRSRGALDPPLPAVGDIGNDPGAARR